VIDLLVAAKITHRWTAGLELRVPASLEVDTDQVFDQLTELSEEAVVLEEVGYAEVPPGQSAEELVVGALSHLFEAADRLMHRPYSRGAARDFESARLVVLDGPAPGGFSPQWWTEVRHLTEELAASLVPSPDDDQIRSAAHQLRDALKGHV
jgi:hypothetical protein